MTDPTNSIGCTVSRDGVLPTKCPEPAVKMRRTFGELVPVAELPAGVVWMGHAVCARHEHAHEARSERSVITLHETTVD